MIFLKLFWWSVTNEYLNESWIKCMICNASIIIFLFTVVQKQNV